MGRTGSMEMIPPGVVISDSDERNEVGKSVYM